MAKNFSKYLGKIALTAAAVLWAGCSDSELEADEPISQTNVQVKSQKVQKQPKKGLLDAVQVFKPGYHPIIELPKLSGVTPLYGCCKTEKEYLEDFSFEEEGVFVEVSKWTKLGKKSNRDFKIIEKKIRGEAKVLFDFYKSFFEKNRLYRYSVFLKVSLDKKGVVKNIEVDSPKMEYAAFENQIVDYVKNLRFKGFASSTFSLNFNFYIPMKENKLSNWGEWQQAFFKRSVKTPNRSDIVVVDAFGLDINDIWSVCRQRTPGLRHIYKSYLKKNPKISGTVVLKIEVGFGGFFKKVEIESSTTDCKEFDEKIRMAVSRWNFGKKQIQGTFKIPFTFYEKEN
jgi:TonB family protein